MNVSNRKCIRRLGWKNMQAARSRNLIAIMAVALTTMLFCTLFTVALSFNHSFQEANFRQAGGYNHGGFKYLTWEQVEELRDAPLIKAYGLRQFVGMPREAPFNKSHVEISYSDGNEAEWMFAIPVEGRLPDEETREAATDTRVLSLLGLEPELGAEFTMTFDVDGKQTTETFTLSGWWEYDSAVVASHVLVPQSRAESIFQKLDTKGLDGMTGTWSLDIMFSNSLNIEKNLKTILADHGYQNEQRGGGDYIAIGVNWGYTGAQMAGSIDPIVGIGIVLLLLLIIVTGYLIIYNVFQISVTNDIRFYGLLKTVGTTGRQLKRIIRLQALSLSCAGIPVGLLAGYFIGVKLTPIILNRLNGVVADAVSASPLIFVFAVVFSLITVLISCRRPGKMAARVSPVEAVRFTETSTVKKARRKAQTGASLPKMAWANLGRSGRKTAIIIISLSLAVVLLNMTVTFTTGFDMDKYLRNMAADYLVADARYFQTGGELWNKDMAVSEEVIAKIQEQGGIAEGGRTYGLSTSAQEFVSEEYFRSVWSLWSPSETVDWMVDDQRLDDGRIADAVQLFGMEQYALDKLDVLAGDISKLSEPGGRYIAAVYKKDDYGNPIMGSNWAGLGEVVTLRYVETFEYYDAETGEILDDISDYGRAWSSRAKTYRDIDYEVAALISVPSALSYRYYGRDEFVLNDQTFITDTKTDAVMYYAFDTVEESSAGMESFLLDLTGSQLTEYDYESKETYMQEFNSTRDMFMILGGVLSFIIGFVGILNFLNVTLTGIMARRGELAVLQSIGMTGRQLKTMLIWEGLYYTLGAIFVSLTLCIVVSPVLGSALSSVFWFFTYRFTILPVLALAPVFAALGILLPLLSYHFIARYSIVERLRAAES